MSALRRGGALICAWVLLSLPSLGAADKPSERPPTPEERQRFIDSTREAALTYSSRLPDFICTQTVKRSVDRGRGRSSLDTLTYETSYYRQHETDKLTRKNGSPAPDYVQLTGMSSRGEFGENLVRIFTPANEAQFQFVKWTTLRGRRAAVYSYRVSRAKKPYALSSLETNNFVGAAAVVGLRGEMVIDAGDFSVLRVEYIADDIPRDFSIRAAKITVDYENAEINGKQYLLPSKAEGAMRSRTGEANNESAFRNYRKFSADSVIEFGAPAPQQ